MASILKVDRIIDTNETGSPDFPNGISIDNIRISGIPGYNYIINGNFDIWQRGDSQTVSGYGSADRWQCLNVGTTKVSSKHAFSLGQTEVPGNPAYFLRHVVSSVVGANSYCGAVQRIEGVKTLAGKKAVLSFYAKADAPKNIAIEIAQAFGTDGGSPTVRVTSQLFALTNAWAKYELVIDIPSIEGKTLGASKTDQLYIMFYFDAGTNYSERAASLGHQSGTFDIACVSLVEGDVDIKPIPRSIGEELALCQRYFQRVGLYGGGLSANMNPHRIASSTTIVDMRNTPSLEILSPLYTNCSGAVVQLTGYSNTFGAFVYPASTGALMHFTCGVALDAEL